MFELMTADASPCRELVMEVSDSHVSVEGLNCSITADGLDAPGPSAPPMAYKFEPTKPVVSSHRAVGISGRAAQLSVAVVYAFIVATIVDPLGLPPIMQMTPSSAEDDTPANATGIDARVAHVLVATVYASNVPRKAVP